MGAAFAPNGALWITALDEQQRLFIQTTSDEGRSWSKPRVIDTGTDTVIADGESRPKLAFGSKGQVVIAYSEPLALPYTGRIRMLRSEDEGRSFSAPFTVHQDPQVITHRFESVAFDAKGTLHTLWVDKRDPEALTRAALAAAASAASAAPAATAASAASTTMAAAVSTAASAPPGRRPRVKIDYRGAAIYRNESVDGGRTFGPDTKLADYTCECCRIALAEAPDGSLVALWRHVFEPNQRDHAFAPVAGPARAEPVRATFDRWAIDACPHHGPGLTPAQGGGYHAVWFGLRAGDSRVRYGRLRPDGSPDGDATSLPDDKAEHAAILSAGPQVAVLWRSFDGQATALRAWVSGDDGRHFVLKDLARSASDNDHPLLARRGSQIFALWRTTAGVRVERLAP
jgi:hypothetical protein